MTVDIKNAIEMVQLWQKGLRGTAEVKDLGEVSAAVPDGNLMVPSEIVANCHGICFLFYIKAGFIFSGEIGTGFVVRRLDKGMPNERWSAPTAITSGGMGWGLLAGAEKTYSAVFLQSESAVKVFGDKAKVNFGGDLSLSVGPVGRHADVKGDVGTGGAALSYSYSYSKGLYGGLSLNGAVAGSNPMMNKTFYGHDASAKDLIEGATGANHQAPELQSLFRELDELMALASQSKYGSFDQSTQRLVN